MSEWDRFTGIHDVVGIERALDRAHQIHRFAVLLRQCIELVPADPVLARAGSSHGDRAPAHAGCERFRPIALTWLVRIEQHHEMEIPITHMAYDGRGETTLRDIGLRFQYAVGQARDRYAGVRRESRGPGLER